MIPLFPERIPSRLKDAPQWVLWRYESRLNPKTGETNRTKVPYNPNNGYKASSTDESTWGSFDIASTRLFDSQTRQNPFDGVGYVLTPADGIVGVDLDHVYNPESGELEPWAKSIVDTLASYSEITPSGEGLRIFIEGTLPPKGRKKANYENYVGGRFLTITGQHLEGTPIDILSRHAQILQVHADVFKEKDAPPRPERPPVNLAEVPGALGLEISARLERAFASQSGAKISALYAGDWLHHSSQSEADSDLCFRLAYWLDADASLIDRAFRGSGLMRDKWDESRSSEGKTYGELTVEAAVAKVSATYGQHLAEREAQKGLISVPKRLAEQKAAAVANGIITDKPTTTGTPKVSQNSADFNWKSEVEDDDVDVDDESAFGEQTRKSDISYVRDGLSVFVDQEKMSPDGKVTPSWKRVSNFYPVITKERRTHGPDGVKYESFLEVRSSTGVRSDWVDAKTLGSPRELAGVLFGLSGSTGVIEAGMEKHLAASIRSLSAKSKKKVPVLDRWMQTGWHKKHNSQGEEEHEFRIKGFLPLDAELELPSQLPYRVEQNATEADLRSALIALEAITGSQDEGAMCAALSFAFTAPAARTLGLSNDTYACFIAGETGSLKTSITQTIMCLYGPNFALDRCLIKMGEGATNVALMRFATHARHLPVLYDNFKPNTGGGNKSFTGLLHNLVEGSDKARGNQNGGLRATSEIETWPFFTGESLPDDDAAAVARLLPLSLSKKGRNERALTVAQEHAHYLCYLGGAWIEWLSSEEGVKAALELQNTFAARRSEWNSWLNKNNTGVPNPLRLASNLASNELVWSLMSQCPHLAAFCAKHADAYRAGLEGACSTSASFTTQARECDVFLRTLASLLETDRVLLAEITQQIDIADRPRMIGHWAADGGAYLFLDLAIKAVLDNHPRGRDALNGFSAAAISRQLRDGDHLVITGSDKHGNLSRIRVADNGSGKPGQIRRTHIKASSLDVGTGVTPEDEDDEM